MKRKISQECCWIRAEDAPFVSGVVVCCRCHWESRLKGGGEIAQAWATWPGRCFGTKWYGDVPGARSTQDGDTGNEDDSSFARFFKLDKYAMFSFAMTSGLASDSDEFEIIIILRRAQKFGDTGPLKNVDFCSTHICMTFFTISAEIYPEIVLKCDAGFERRTLRLSLALSSVVGAIGRADFRKIGEIAQAWATWPEGASAPNGTVMCRWHGVPEMVTSAMRATAVLLGFSNLTNMPCSVLP